MLTYWLGLGPSATVVDLDIDPGTNTVSDKMLAMMDATYAEGDCLAIPAREPLAHGPDHFPLPGNDLQRLRDVLTQL